MWPLGLLRSKAGHELLGRSQQGRVVKSHGMAGAGTLVPWQGNPLLVLQGPVEPSSFPPDCIGAGGRALP